MSWDDDPYGFDDRPGGTLRGVAWALLGTVAVVIAVAAVWRVVAAVTGR